MKKTIKILSILFLLGGFSNLAGSQNIKTFATNYCFTANDLIQNVDDFENGSIMGCIHKQYLQEQQGALLTIYENSRFQKCYFCIDENQFYSNNHINRYNLLNDCLEKKVTIEIIDENGNKYTETSPPLYFNYSKNDPEDVHYFLGCFTLGDYNSIKYVDKETKEVISQKIRVPDETTQEVNKNFNMEIGKKYVIKIFVNNHLVSAKTVKAKDIKEDIRVIECANAKKTYEYCSSVLKQHDGIMLGVHPNNRRVPRIYISKSNINLSNPGANEKFVLEITDKNGKKYIDKQFIPSFNDVGNFYFSKIPLDFDEKDSRVLFPKKESVDNAFELNTDEQYTIKLKQNNELVMEKQVTAMDLNLMDKKLKTFKPNG